MQYLDF